MGVQWNILCIFQHSNRKCEATRKDVQIHITCDCTLKFSQVNSKFFRYCMILPLLKPFSILLLSAPKVYLQLNPQWWVSNSNTCCCADTLLLCQATKNAGQIAGLEVL
jgi:hypothetical protein